MKRQPERPNDLTLGVLDFVLMVLFLLAAHANSPLQIPLALGIFLISVVAFRRLPRSLKQLIYEFRLFWKVFDDD